MNRKHIGQVNNEKIAVFSIRNEAKYSHREEEEEERDRFSIHPFSLVLSSSFPLMLH